MFQLVKRVIPPSKVFKGQLPFSACAYIFSKIQPARLTCKKKKKKGKKKAKWTRGKITNLRDVVYGVNHFEIVARDNQLLVL